MKLSQAPFKKKRIRKGLPWAPGFADRTLRKIKGWGLLGLMGLCFLAQDYLKPYGDYFRSALIEPPRIEYQGATFPIKKVPNWVDLSDTERLLTYDQLSPSKFIDLPRYNISDFKAGQIWRTATESQRNAYITYPVPHLGNYKLDGSEYSGSHPGIDIKVPIGTPVYASTAGFVYKVDYQPQGFGHNVVIQSDNVPDPSDFNRNITIFTTYAHLSKTSVKDRQRVNKGDLIGFSGNSGMATSPHLHWQIDRFGAPFHGYWPFVWSDVEKAGYSSFFEAVKNGLNQNLAREHTIHPANFVAQVGDLIDTNLVASSDNQVDHLPTPEVHAPVAEEKPEAPQPEKEESLPVVIEPEIVELAPIKTNAPGTSPEQVDRPTRSWRNQFELSFETDEAFLVGEGETITVKAENVHLLESGIIHLSSTLKDLADIKPIGLRVDDFVDGKASFVVTTNSARDFRIIAESPFGEEKSPILKAQVFRDVAPDHPYSESILFLKDKGTIQGYADGTFGLFQNLNRAEAVKIILNANGIASHHIPQNLLSDTPGEAWFSPWVSKAVSENIVKGYPDGTFRPSATMTRAEFFKVAILTAGFDEAGDTLVASNYRDVPSDAWFVGYLGFAKKHNLLPPTNQYFIEPGKPITRGEAAYVIHQLWKLRP